MKTETFVTFNQITDNNFFFLSDSGKTDIAKTMQMIQRYYNSLYGYPVAYTETFPTEQMGMFVCDSKLIFTVPVSIDEIAELINMGLSETEHLEILIAGNVLCGNRIFTSLN